MFGGYVAVVGGGGSNVYVGVVVGMHVVVYVCDVDVVVVVAADADGGDDYVVVADDVADVVVLWISADVADVYDVCVTGGDVAAVYAGVRVVVGDYVMVAVVDGDAPGVVVNDVADV